MKLLLINSLGSYSKIFVKLKGGSPRVRKLVYLQIPSEVFKTVYLLHYYATTGILLREIF